MREADVPAAGGGTLRAYDTGAGAAGTLLWHPGSPHTGAPLAPLAAAAAERGLRLVTYARPSYGASTPRPGRRIADGAADAARVADAFGVRRFAVLGYSGGGPHALACAALLPDRVTVVATLACLAPFSGTDDWFATMASDRALRAAVAGRDARARVAETEAFDPDTFSPSDWAALAGEWGPLGEDAQAAERVGPDGLVDDDVAVVRPWGFDVGAITAPALLVHGDEDRVVPYTHSARLHRDIPGSTLWPRRGAGHVSVLRACPEALDWLVGPH
jgi:pimeloyl-ACP methyl ester carboxylesterase